MTMRRLRPWNRILAAGLLAAYGAFLLISLMVQAPPYDYFLLMRGAVRFCYQPEAFAYGLAQNNYYPAPFYTAFCWPAANIEPILRTVFVMLPPLLALILARGRAAILSWPPLVSLVHIGQSSWLLLPMYMAARRSEDQRPLHPAWGVGLVTALFKPHIAVPAGLWLLWREWRNLRFWLVAILSGGVLLLISFMLRPDWPSAWLANVRELEPTVVSLALIPIRLGFSNGVVLLICLGLGLLLLALIHRIRGSLRLYDWVLIYFAVSPFIIYYDLVLLLPFIGPKPRRLLLALCAGLPAWVYATMTGLRWDLSSLILVGLLAERLLSPRLRSAGKRR